MNKRGFTLVELLLATAFFSFILMFVVVGFVQINRSYTRGVTVRRVQNNARSVLEDITRSIRDSGGVDNVAVGDDTKETPSPAPFGAWAPDGYVHRICIGDLRYGWNQNTNPAAPSFTSEKLTGNQEYSMVKDYSPSGCGNQFDADLAEPILDENVRVQYINLTPVGTTAYQLTITLSSSESFDLSSYGQNAACDIGVGDQYCDVATLKTIISVRN